MAMQFSHWLVSFTFMDQGSQLTTRSFRSTRGSADYDLVATDAGALFGLLSNLTTAEITGFQITRVVLESAISQPTNAQNQDQALISVTLDTPGIKYASLSIPAPVNGLFVGATGPDNDIVLGTNADLVSLLEMFQDGGNFTISDGEKVRAFAKGTRIHSASRRG